MTDAMAKKFMMARMDALHDCWGRCFRDFFFTLSERERSMLRREMTLLERTPGWTISIDEDGSWEMGVA